MYKETIFISHFFKEVCQKIFSCSVREQGAGVPEGSPGGPGQDADRLGRVLLRGYQHFQVCQYSLIS